ncbi:MAG TPA: sigma factor-like helix-turn-helix DNA-binding protein [Solirubrobacter sp.]|nr:sigma factor-like helix-turn-helix DNA-binding protein [Solirubrobacter sp.]
MLPSATLERLYARQADRLLAFFVRRTVDPQIAADLWAETFAQTVAGHRRRNALSGDDDRDAAFLFAIARRELARYYRRGYAEQRALQRLGLERPELTGDPAAHVQAVAELDELRAAVAAALAELPDSLRDAVRLRIVERRAYADVAAALAIAEPAARARVSRGLKALAAHLRESDPTTTGRAFPIAAVTEVSA